MKIGMVQMSSVTDNLMDNEKVMTVYIMEAVEAGAKMICFPEMALVGYSFEDMDRRINDQYKIIETLQKMAVTHGITIVVGGLEKEADTYYISQFVLGETLESYRKIHVGQREGTYVGRGKAIKTFKTQGIEWGIMLCYDGHFPEIATIMANQGAMLILNPSAAPNRPEDRVTMWQKYLTARAYDNRVWVAATNLRFQGKGGGILVINAEGNRVDQSVEPSDGLVLFDFEPQIYSKTSMKKRDFKVDRRAEIYKQYQ